MAKNCEICGRSMEGMAPQRKVCSEPCRKTKKRLYEAVYKQQRPKTPEPVVKTQFCPGCEKRLAAGSFHKNRNEASGLQRYCKKCRSNQAKSPSQAKKDRERKHHWYLRHAEKQIRRFRARYWSDPEFRQALNEANRARYYANREEILAKRREDYRARRELESNGIRRRCSCGLEFMAKPEQFYCSPQCRQASIAHSARLLLMEKRRLG